MTVKELLVIIQSFRKGCLCAQLTCSDSFVIIQTELNKGELKARMHNQHQ